MPVAGMAARVTCTPRPVWGCFVYIWLDRRTVTFFCEVLVFVTNTIAGNANAQTLFLKTPRRAIKIDFHDLIELELNISKSYSSASCKKTQFY